MASPFSEIRFTKCPILGAALPTSVVLTCVAPALIAATEFAFPSLISSEQVTDIVTFSIPRTFSFMYFMNSAVSSGSHVPAVSQKSITLAPEATTPWDNLATNSFSLLEVSMKDTSMFSQRLFAYSTISGTFSRTALGFAFKIYSI